MSKGLTRELMAIRAAAELEEGMYVNLGMGIPGLVANYLSPDKEIILHTENGMLGYGPAPPEEEINPNLLNAGGQPVTVKPGASFFHHADSFIMLRGGHVDVFIAGAFQVSEQGDLANWRTLHEEAVGGVGGVGGGMDAVYGARRVIITMMHTDKDDKSRVVKQCTLPITARKAVNTIITNLAVIEVTPQGLLLKETCAGVSPEEVQAVTEPRLILSPDLKEVRL